jgi:hypothetical protein
MAVPDRLDAIPITCCQDGQDHDVTDENVAAGQHTDRYQARCGYLVLAAVLVTPVGQPCASCTALVAAQPISSTPWRRVYLQRVG